MGSQLIQDTPGFFNTIVEGVASVASNGADTLYQPFAVAPRDGVVSAVYWLASASQAGATDHYRTMKIINLGSAGAGTVEVARLSLTASKAANAPHAFTMQAGSAVTAGDLLAYYTVSGGSGVAVIAGNVQLHSQ